MRNRESKFTHIPFKCGQSSSRATADILIAASNEIRKICIFCSSIQISNYCFLTRKAPLVKRQAIAEKAHCCFLRLMKGRVIAKCRMKACCLLCKKVTIYFYVEVCQNNKIMLKLQRRMNYLLNKMRHLQIFRDHPT